MANKAVSKMRRKRPVKVMRRSKLAEHNALFALNNVKGLLCDLDNELDIIQQYIEGRAWSPLRSKIYAN